MRLSLFTTLYKIVFVFLWIAKQRSKYGIYRFIHFMAVIVSSFINDGLRNLSNTYVCTRISGHLDEYHCIAVNVQNVYSS